MGNGKITKILLLSFFVIVFMGTTFSYLFPEENNKKNNYMDNQKINLPEPLKESEFSVEEALKERRSVRSFKDEELTLQEVSQILWAAQGITQKETGFRSAPSAGATYPLEVYLVVRKVEGLDPGVYRFLPEEQALHELVKGDKSEELMSGALNQGFIEDAPVNIVFTAVYGRTVNRYGERGERYVYMEAGHAAQNIYLQCESLDLGTVVIGAFDNEKIRRTINASREEKPLYIIPIGRKN